MTFSTTDPQAPLNPQLLTPDFITLTPEQIEQATELSDGLSSTEFTDCEKWRFYLNALALTGVVDWLQDCAPQLSAQSVWLTAPESGLRFSGSLHSSDFITNAMVPTQSISHLQIEDFRLHLITIEHFNDGFVAIPQLALNHSHLDAAIPHFYVLVQVFEEISQVRVYGYLRRDQWLAHCPTVELMQQLRTDGEQYWVPIDWFTFDANALLLMLQFLDPVAIPLVPAPVAEAVPPVSTQQGVNVWRWLTQAWEDTQRAIQTEAEALAQDWGWLALPSLAFESDLRTVRSPIEEFETLVTELSHQSDLEIPLTAVSRYRDVQLEDQTLRLYAVIWQVPTAEDTVEWDLLIILSPQNQAMLPGGIQLEISDETNVLVNPQLNDSENEYLYAQVGGVAHERFWVTISLANGAALTLPPFTFVVNE